MKTTITINQTTLEELNKLKAKLVLKGEKLTHDELIMSLIKTKVMILGVSK